jgi:hypothetical protein
MSGGFFGCLSVPLACFDCNFNTSVILEDFLEDLSDLSAKYEI